MTDLPDARPQPERRQPVSGSRLIDSPAAAAEALRDYFLANADRADNAANDELVAEMVRRIRTQHASGDGVADPPQHNLTPSDTNLTSPTNRRSSSSTL